MYIGVTADAVVPSYGLVSVTAEITKSALLIVPSAVVVELTL